MKRYSYAEATQILGACARSSREVVERDKVINNWYTQGSYMIVPNYVRRDVWVSLADPNEWVLAR